MLRALDLSAYQIGKASGVYRTNITDFLAGRKKLSGESIDRICEAYGFALVDTRSGRKPRAARPAVANPGEKTERSQPG